MNLVLWLTLLLAAADLGAAVWWGAPGLGVAATVALGFVVVRCRQRRGDIPSAAVSQAVAAAAPAAPRGPYLRPAADADDPAALVEQMLAQGRCALVLRPQIAATLDDELFARALAALSLAMALVPEGEVVLGRETEDEPGRVFRLAPFFLDRCPVTNQQYQEFVAAGGYEQLALWDATIWPAVLEFVDRTGLPGPRYWRDGGFPPGEEHHPVIGVSWYEASACARWLGKRLPSDAEWVKAVAWPVQLSPAVRVQRRYPWGDTMDRAKANLWGSGPGRIVSVHAFAAGTSVGGVQQLVGNVWEWLSGAFAADDRDGSLRLPTPMKSIRGGAFDTYFDDQAACQFQSGENPLARRHNIGFRCAIGVCDLLLARGAASDNAGDDASGDEPPVGAAAATAEQTP